MVTVTTFAWSVLFDYYLALLLFAVTFAVLFVITRSQTGDVLTAIRENEDTVAAVGFNVAKFKLYAFVVSAVVGGFAGAVFVHSIAGNPLNPQQILVVAVSVDIVVMAILGGMGTIVGGAVGATFFVATSYVLESVGDVVVIPLVGESLASLMPAPLLVLALLVVVFRPRGLVPALVDAGRWLATDPTNRATTGQGDDSAAPLEQVLERYRDTLDR